jgi:hypothetical protein
VLAQGAEYTTAHEYRASDRLNEKLFSVIPREEIDKILLKYSNSRPASEKGGSAIRSPARPAAPRHLPPSRDPAHAERCVALRRSNFIEDGLCFGCGR